MMLFFAFLLFLQPSPATTPKPTAPPADLKLYLMTMSPGGEVWERFGHNMIRAVNTQNNVDVCFNYGLFDFHKQNFFQEFAQGRMTYWMQGLDSVRSIEFYVQQKRHIRSQELNLTEPQRLQLAEYLINNELPANREYRYDYFRDNCSTRVRDALNDAVGGSIKTQLDALPALSTYRGHAKALTADNPFWFFTLDFILGPYADQPITRWDECFLPAHLADAISIVKLADGSPLIKSTYTLGAPGPAPVVTEAPNRAFAYAGIGTAAALAMILPAWWYRRGRRWRILFCFIGFLVALVVGLAGAVPAFLWAFTDHVAGYRNENLLQASPLHLFVAVAILFARPVENSTARWSAMLVLCLSLVGLGLKWVPACIQQNGQIIALFLPINLGLVLATWLAFWRTRPEWARVAS